jgi:flagellin
MSLGVLNNLSAVYAENNLNNSNNSLNTVLQQLSSGSKINSGADDAAGLSLVNGLQANQQALTQSITNATEGVGLLQVADGALSQVTSLLNRAVTLATEASNGTLNSSQDTAANQEYQSILSEISNIGSTTTYNDEGVFGSNTNIYTGDASTTGSAINDLNIRTLSSSNVGDSGGVMAYSNGTNNVFLNLSTSTVNATVNDTLAGGASGSTTLDVTYLLKGNGSTESTATTTITTGGTSGFANTVGGLMSAINSQGSLGLSATFTTQAQAGVQGGGTETGIQISGGLVSAGVDPNASSTSGTLDLTGLAANATLALGATVAITQGANSNTFTIGASNNTLNTLAQAINAYTLANPAFAVNANVITNGDGTQSLALSDAAGGGALTVFTGAGTTQAPVFTTGVAGTVQNIQTQGADTTGTKAVLAVNSTVTVGTGSGTEAYTDLLTAGSSITITNSNLANPQTLIFTVGAGTDNTIPNLNTYYTGNQDSTTGGDTLGNLADTINAKSGTLGVYATVTSSGLQLNTGIWTSGNYATSGANTSIAATQTAVTGENVTATSTLSSATSGTQLVMYNPQIGGVAGGGQPTIMAYSATNGGAAVATLEGDILSGTFQVNGSQGASATFTMNGTTDTYTTLVNDINGANVGVSASFNPNLDGTGNGGLELTSTDSTNMMTVVNGALTDTTAGFALTKNSLHVLDFGTTANAASDILAGGAAGDFTIAGSGGTFTDSITDSSISALIGDINTTAGTNVTASFDANLNAGLGGILLSDTTAGAGDAMADTTLVDNNAGVATANPLTAPIGNGTQQIEGLSLAAAGGAEGNFLSGSVQVVGPHGVYTFTGNGTSTTFDTLATDITNANIGVTAAYNPNAGGAGLKGIVLIGSDTSNVIAFNHNTLIDVNDANDPVATLNPIVAGNNVTNVATSSTAVLQLSGANVNDSTSTLNGAIQINYNGQSQTFIMGAQPSNASELVGGAIYTGGTTVQDLVNAINSTQTGGQNNTLNTNGTTFQATAPGGGTGGIYLQGMAGNASPITLTTINPAAPHGVSTPLSVTTALAAGATTNGLTGVTGIDAGDNITTGGTTIATNDTVAGSITVTNGGTNIGLDTGLAAGLPSVTNVYATGSTSEQDALTSGTTFAFTTNAGKTFSYTAAAGDTWQTLVTDINNSATVGMSAATGVTASWSASAGGAGNGGIVLTNNYNGPTNVTVSGGNTLEDQTLNNANAHNLGAATAGEVVQAGAGGSPAIAGFRGGATDLEGDLLTASTTATFAVDGKSYTYTAAAAGTDTWQTLITDINSSSIGTANPYGVTASWSATGGGAGDAGMVLTDNWNSADAVTFTAGGGASALKDATAGTVVSDTPTQAGGGTPTVTVLDSGAAAASTDTLTGSITMTDGAHSYAFTAAAGNNTWQNLVSDINNSAIGTADNSGVTAVWNPNADGTGIGGIVLTGNEGGANPVAVTSNSLVDQATAVTDTFTVGSGADGPNQFYTQSTNGAVYANTVSGLASMVTAQSSTLNVTAQANSAGLTFTQSVANGGSIATSANSLTDVTAGTYNKATSTQLASENDTLSGSMVFTVGSGNSQTVNMSAITGAKTVSGLISYINTNSSTLGVSATWVPSAGPNANFGAIQLISGTQGSTGTVTVNGPLTSLTDTTTGSALSYTSGAAYNMGLSGAVTDSTNTATGTYASDNRASSGIATISYSDGAGVSLSATNLSNQTAAESALTSLNSAITAVAAQDGYVGAQINTLNAVSQVISTQQENVESAQNAVQATDYAAATSNMSKYEILSQTGIAALAQANTVQQEVLKLI